MKKPSHLPASQLEVWAGILAFMVSRYLQRAILVLFHLLVIVVPFAFTWVNEELFEFPKMLVTYSLTVGILGLWISRMIVEQRIIFRRTPFDIPIAVFVFSQLASTIFSIHPYTSFFGYYTRFHGGLLSTITYVTLFYAFVSTISKKQIRGLLISTLIAALGASLYAIPEHFGRSPSCYLITGGQEFSVSCWVQDVQSRIFGTFGQPNWLAAYVITLLPVALSLALLQFGSKLRNALTELSVITLLKASAYLGLVGILYTVLLFTQSKSGILGLVVGLVSWVGLVIWTSWRVAQTQHSPSSPNLKSIGLTVVCLGLILVGISQAVGRPFAPDFSQFASRYLPVFRTETASSDPAPVAAETAPVVNRLDVGGTDSGEIRKIVWTGAWQVFQRYPVFGSGVETFAYSYYQDRPAAHNLVSEWDFLYNKAHNEFLNYLATTGLVGFGAYTLLLVWFGIWILKTISSADSAPTPADRYLLIGFLAGIISLSISNLLGFSTVMVTVLMYFYLAMSASIVANEIKVPDTTPTPSGLQQLSLAGVGISVLYLWWMIFSWWAADKVYTLGKQYIQSGYTWEGLANLEAATQQAPSEALFFDELANTYALIASSLGQQQDATSAAQVAEAAIATSDRALELNPRHLNFHKSRARVFINLANLDPSYFIQAKEALMMAIALSPTDAKLRFNLALVESAMGQIEEAEKTLQETVALKPNYEAAYLELARLYQAQGKTDQAREQYQYIISHVNATNPVVLDEFDQLNRTATASGQAK